MNITAVTARRLQDLSVQLLKMDDADSSAAWERGYAASAADFAVRMLFPGGDPETIASYVADLIGQWIADRKTGVGFATSPTSARQPMSHSTQ